MTFKLKEFNNKNYKPGPLFKRLIWYFISMLFFETNIPFPSKFKIFILKIFGARIYGWQIVIKPNVKIKYPWFLKIGDGSWIGERVWIDNLCDVEIDENVCISQGVVFLTGNHDFKSPNFDLFFNKIKICKNSWIGAHSLVVGGSNVSSNSIYYAGSKISSKSKPDKIIND